MFILKFCLCVYSLLRKICSGSNSHKHKSIKLNIKMYNISTV